MRRFDGEANDGSLAAEEDAPMIKFGDKAALASSTIEGREWVGAAGTGMVGEDADDDDEDEESEAAFTSFWRRISAGMWESTHSQE